MERRKPDYWKLEGKEQREGKNMFCKFADAIFPDNSKRRYSAGDFIKVHVDEGKPPWVGHVVEFFYDPSQEEDERQRVALRWMYDDNFVDEEADRGRNVPKPDDVKEDELFYTDHFDWDSNSVQCIVGKAHLFPTEEHLKEATKDPDTIPGYEVGDSMYLCRCFYDCRSKQHALRSLEMGELSYMRNNAGSNDMKTKFADIAQHVRARHYKLEDTREEIQPDARIAVKRRRSRRDDPGRAIRMRRVDADDEEPVDFNHNRPMSIAEIMSNRTKVFKLPPGAELN